MKQAFKLNDGGRAAAGYKGKTSDCVTRAVAIITGMPYADAYELVNHHCKAAKKGKGSARTGVPKPVTRKIMEAVGGVWTPTMAIGKGCTVHLNAKELPSGRIIASCSRHVVAMIDGVINDSNDPTDRASTVYPNGYPEDKLPKNAVRMENGNGWVYAPERCVYGYWTFKGKA